MFGEAETGERLLLRAILAPLFTRLATQARPTPAASANPTATSPEITCRHPRPRWIFSFCTSGVMPVPIAY